METPVLEMLDLSSWGVVPVACKTDKKQSALALWPTGELCGSFQTC